MTAAHNNGKLSRHQFVHLLILNIPGENRSVNSWNFPWKSMGKFHEKIRQMLMKIPWK
jgi:hypothetical protein